MDDWACNLRNKNERVNGEKEKEKFTFALKN